MTGILLIVIGLIWLVYAINKDIYIIDEENGKVNVRIVNKFVWIKTLPDFRYQNKTIFLSRSNIIQVKKVNSDTWIDVSWAAAQ